MITPGIAIGLAGIALVMMLVILKIEQVGAERSVRKIQTVRKAPR